MSDQRIDTAKVRACSALLGEPSVTVVWQLANEIDRLTAESAQKDARIAELEAATRWRPMSECPDSDVEILLVRSDRKQPQIEWAHIAMWSPFALGWLPIPAFEEPKP